MTTALQTYQFRNLNLECVEIDGMPWFIASPIAIYLDYQNPARDIRTHVDEEDVLTMYIPTKSANYTLINESGLYSLMVRSNKPEAKPFRRWITSEVLPSLRKTGHYSVNPNSSLDHHRLQQQHEVLKRYTLRNNRSWRKIARYKALGLSNYEVAKLLGLGESTVRAYSAQMHACGLLPKARQLDLFGGV